MKDYTNLSDKLENKTTLMDIELSALSQFTSNENVWMTDARFNPKVNKTEHMKAYEEELENRPVNSHFHPVKGMKWDVATPEDQKYKMENERLGDMVTLPNEVTTLLRFRFFIIFRIILCNLISI